MTRKNFILRLVAVMLVLSAILPVAAASAPVEVNQGEPQGELKTVYITWQYPIPPSEKGDKLNVSVGVLIDGKTYASHDVFNILGIPKCPFCEAIAITVDGYPGLYYPLRESAEQFGYSVLWAARAESDGIASDYWVYIAPQYVGTDWIKVQTKVADYRCINNYYYVYSYNDECWCYVWDDETKYIPKADVTVVE